MKPLLLGLVGGVAFCGMNAAFGLHHSHDTKAEQILTPKPMFEVVDDYKGCDVIRYTSLDGCIHYFMHCGDKV